MRRGVVLGSAAILLLGGGLLWSAGSRPPGDADPAGDERSLPRGPGLAAAPRPAPPTPAPAPPLPRLAPEVDAALTAVLAITAQSDPTAVQALIAALSRALCVEGDAHRAILERALHATESSERAVRAVILALGRCGREEVLRELVRALRDPTTPIRERESIVLALAQPREAEFHAPDGVVVSQMGDVSLSGPIRERFVLDALLEAIPAHVRTSWPPGTDIETMRAATAPGGLRLACIQALGGSAGDADDVLDALAALAKREPDLRSIVLSSLVGARPGPHVTGYARLIAEDRSSAESSLQGSLGLWMQGDRTTAIDFVLSELDSSDATDARKALLIRFADGFVPFGDDVVPDLERLTVAGVAWARAHPKVVTRYDQDVGPPGTPPIPVELDMLDVAEGLTSNNAGRGRSPVLRKLAADTFVDRMRRHSTSEQHRRPPRWLSNRLEGDDAYLLLVLEGLRTASLDDETLLDVVDVLTGPRPGYPTRSPAVATAVARVAERLTPAARERLEARRREAKPR